MAVVQDGQFFPSGSTTPRKQFEVRIGSTIYVQAHSHRSTRLAAGTGVLVPLNEGTVLSPKPRRMVRAVYFETLKTEAKVDFLGFGDAQ